MYINGSANMYNTVVLQPSWLQYIIIELPSILFCAGLFAVFYYMTFPYHYLFGIPWLVMIIYLLYRAFYMQRMRYVITEEQIIIHHGVFSHSTDYVELYRVVDYSQHQTLLQQIFGVKTVSIYSGDRNNPKLDMIGIPVKTDVVGLVRCRVEANKKRKGIYEITNRF